MEGGQRGVEREAEKREREKERDRPGRMTERTAKAKKEREKIVENALERKKRKGAI